MTQVKFGMFGSQTGLCPAGPAATDGADGVDAESPARVADDGSGVFTSLSAALASITDASVSMPYVDVERSGEGVTTITCACVTGETWATVVVSDVVAEMEIRHLTIENTGGDSVSYGVYNSSSSPSMTDVTATGTGFDGYGVYNSSSSSSSSSSIRTSALSGNTNSPFNESGSSAEVAATMLDGTVVAGGGLTCVGTYDETFVALTCS